MRKIIVPDNRGRITIQEDIRKEIGLTPETILSIETLPDNSLIIKKEKVCNNCRENETSLEDIVMNYSETERDKALIKLSGDWAKRKGGELNA